MSESPDEYGDVLRRALRAEAQSVVPSPEGLEIIRTRIERRGVRGLFWWRAAASAAGAVLVAATVVMVVPELRESVVPQPFAPVQYETTPPDKSHTKRPPAPTQASSTEVGKQQPAVVVPVSPSPGTPKPTPAPSPSRSGKCPTPAPEPSVIPAEPVPAGGCPSVKPKPSASPSTAVDPSVPADCAGECPDNDPVPAPTDQTTPGSTPAPSAQ